MHPCDGILLSNRKQKTDTHNSLGKSPRNSPECEINLIGLAAVPLTYIAFLKWQNYRNGTI